MQQPLVTIILLTIDRHQFISSCIESIINQKYQNWELVIVHDGNDRRMAPIINKYSSIDKRIVYFNRKKIGNIANGINFAIFNSAGKYIAILDDDDVWIDRYKLNLQVNELEKDPLLLAIGGGAVVVDENGKESISYRRSLNPEDCKRKGLLANPIIHSTVLYKRSAIIKIGYYDESLSGYQDWDVFLKFMRIGKVSNIDKIFVRYRVWNGGGTSRNVMNNAISNLRIVIRHRRCYSGFNKALTAAIIYIAFSLLPNPIRRYGFQIFSVIKKNIFSN